MLIKLLKSVLPGLVKRICAAKKDSKNNLAIQKASLNILLKLLVSLKDDDLKVELSNILSVIIENCKSDPKLCRETLSTLLRQLEIISNADCRLKFAKSLKSMKILNKSNSNKAASRIVKYFTVLNEKAPEDLGLLLNLIECFAEILAAFPSAAGHACSLIIQDYASVVKKFEEIQSEDIIKQLYSWECIAKFWLAAHLIAKNHKNHQFKPLTIPLINLISQSASATAHERYFPFKFQIVKILNHIQSQTKLFIPTLAILISIFHIYNFNSEPQKKSDPALKLNFSILIKVSQNHTKSMAFKRELIEQFCQNAIEHLKIWQNSLAFPELCLPLTLWVIIFSFMIDF